MEIANNNPTIKMNPLRDLSVPDIDSKLVLLMGLSQGGYLGAKYVARPILQVTGFILDKDSKLITIFGESFGEEPGIVKLKTDSSETTLTIIKEKGWSDTRINIDPSEKFDKGQNIIIITNDGLDVSQVYEPELRL